jgi:hypothetical protein
MSWGSTRRAWAGLAVAGLAAFALATPLHAEEGKRCKGGKQLFQGRCLYPDEIARLKAESEKKRQADEARRKAEKDKRLAQEQAARDDLACTEARQTTNADRWKQYLADFPDGRCAGEAHGRIAALAPRPAEPAPLPPPPPALPPEPKAEQEDDSWLGPSPLVWIGFGVGAAGFLTWGIAGGVAIGKRSALDEQCPDKVCPSSAQGDLDSATAAAHASTVGMVVGFAGAAVGILGLLLPVFTATDEQAEKPTPAPSEGDAPVAVELVLAPGTVGLQGTF